jgi:hypothetical protein
LVVVSTWLSAVTRTASVLVPPTSMPMRI